MKTIPLVDNVAPRENDMMLPLSRDEGHTDCNAADEDAVFSSEKRLIE